MSGSVFFCLEQQKLLEQLALFDSSNGKHRSIDVAVARAFETDL